MVRRHLDRSETRPLEQTREIKALRADLEDILREYGDQMRERKNARLALTTSGQAAYTCPAGKTAEVVKVHVANVDGVANVNVTIWWTDDSAADAVTRLCYLAPVTAADALNISCGTFLEPGDQIVGQASTNGDAELTLAIIEIEA